MKTVNQIETELNKAYKALDKLRKEVNKAVDQIGGICDSVEVFGIEELDSSLMDTSAKNLFEAAESIGFLADDDVPFVASLLRERFEYDKEYCPSCDKPFVVSVGDDERQVSHNGCQE